MHNDIMAASSKERSPMLAPSNYAQWSSRFMRYVDIKPNNDQLRQCIEKGPYILIELVTSEVPAEGDNPVQPQVGYRKPKRAKDYEYHKEKMMLCKQESKCIPISAEQDEWLQDTDEEPDKQELEAHYMYMAKIQEVLHAADDNSGHTYDAEPLEKVHTNDDYNVFANETQRPESINDTYLVEKTDRNVIHDSLNMCDNEGKAGHNVDEPEDERIVLASLTANLKLDIDENKIKHKQLKKANTSLSQELEKSKQDLFYCISDLKKYKIFQTNHKDKEKAELECQKALGFQIETK
nr:hypothetical protein [Tanacetum cinerariifolium]